MSVEASQSAATAPTATEIDALAVQTIRFLAADMVQAANSGHPGMPMGAAAMAWTLWSRHLRHDPSASGWPDRDRFVLSAGHGSALQYALLHLFGYDLPMDQLRAFRQLDSATPGHPEFGHTDGVETTTGPLGQGLAMAVGLALAERMQAARYPLITDHHTYAIVGDGCLMEGVSHEAASLAGHLRLGRLVVLWDDNQITIDGAVDASCSDDQLARFTAYGWHVVRVEDGNDIEAIDAALTEAKADPRPSFIAVRTVIGDGAPEVAGTSKAHGSPLGPAVLAAAKDRAGWAHPPFTVPDPVAEHCGQLSAAGGKVRADWQDRWEQFAACAPAAAARWQRSWRRELPPEVAEVIDALALGEAATRQSSQQVLTAVRAVLPELVGGSADLAGSTGTATGGEVVRAGDYAGSVINFGIREFAMAAVLNGLSLHGGLRPFGSTFLVFSDYLRPALRLSALMRQPVIHILTHDSIAVGEDGPTHQPVEHVESLRLIPGVSVLRPADGLETAVAWQLALARTDGPTALILSRQALPALTGSGDLAAQRHCVASTGARLVREADQPRVHLLATGSEVSLALATADLLAAAGVPTAVTSVLDRARYAESRVDRNTDDGGAGADGGAPVLRVSLEAGCTGGWAALADLAIGVDTFGASGPASAVLERYGLTAPALCARILDHLAQSDSKE